MFLKKNGGVIKTTKTLENQQRISDLHSNEFTIQRTILQKLTPTQLRQQIKQFQSTTKSKTAKDRWYTPIVCNTRPVSNSIVNNTAIHSWYQIEKKFVSETDLKLLRDYLTLEPANANQFNKSNKYSHNAKFALIKETETNILVPRFFGLSRWGIPKHDFTSEGLPIDIQFNGTLRTTEPSQVKVLNQLYDTLKSGIGGCCASLYCGYGKCFGQGTKFLMHDASKMVVEDLKVGDLLMGDDNTTRTITSLSTGSGLMYKVNPDQNSPAKSFICNDEHILVLKVNNSFTIKNLRHSFLIEWFVIEGQSNIVTKRLKTFPINRGHENRQQAFYAAIDFQDLLKCSNEDCFLWEPTVSQYLKSCKDVQKSCFMFMPGEITNKNHEGFMTNMFSCILNFTPTKIQLAGFCWLFGLLLSSSPGKLSISNSKDSLIDYLKVVSQNLACSFVSKTEQDFVIVDIVGKDSIIEAMNVFIIKVKTEKTMLNQLSLDDLMVRHTILAGMIDANGVVTKPKLKSYLQFSFSHKSKFVCKILKLLSNMSGYRSNKLTIQNENWNVVLRGSNFNKLPIITKYKKLEPCDDVSLLKWSFDIEEIGIGDYYGFTVDDNHRMLLSDFTITHNTVEAIALTCKLGRKTLFIAHVIDLLDQTEARFKQFCPNVKTGFIQGNRFDIAGKDVVFATIQSLLAKNIDQKLLDEFGFVVFDECHHIAAHTFSTVTCKLKPKYMLGLSATLNRRDGLECAVHWLLGPIAAYEIRPPIDVTIDVIKYINPDTQNSLVARFGPMKGKADFVRMTKEMINDSKRNKLIIDYTVDTLKENGRKIVVQSSRKEHLWLLLNGFGFSYKGDDGIDVFENEEKNIWTTMVGKDKLSIGMFTGDFNSRERELALHCDIILATSHKMQEGIDHAPIDTVVFATPLGDVRQSTGRALRELVGKNKPKVLWIDDGFSLWKGMTSKALAEYRKEKYLIIFHPLQLFQ